MMGFMKEEESLSTWNIGRQFDVTQSSSTIHKEIYTHRETSASMDVGTGGS